MNFVDGTGYMVLHSLVGEKDCEVAWGKVMKAWGIVEEKVVANNSELLFKAWASEEPLKYASLPRPWQTKVGL